MFNTNQLSQHTIDRIRAAKITDVKSDEELLAHVDIILSIVPPRDALATAKRVAEASRSAGAARKALKGSDEVIFIDLNAVSPRTAAKINGLLASVATVTPAPASPSIARRLSRTLSSVTGEALKEPSTPPAIHIKFLDGGIIGGPPSQAKDKSKESSDSKSSQDSSWSKPSIPLSGPHEKLLTQDLLQTLNMKFISPKIGTASALKACFASLSKGFSALAILSYTTAATCGVLPELQAHLDEFAPGVRQRAEGGLTAMPPKAYRWVDEMREIGQTFSSSGGLSAGGNVFDGISELYRFVAEDTALGAEKVGKRKRGTTAEDVAEAIEEGIQKKMHKGEPKEEKLELAWRGSWGL